MMILAGMGFLKNVIESGVSFADEKSEKRNIILSNYISIVISLAPLSLLVARYFSGSLAAESSPHLILACVALFLTPLVCNRLGLIQISRMILSWIPSACVMVTTIINLKTGEAYQTSDLVGIRYFLLAFGCIPFLIFNVTKSKGIILGLIGSLFPLLFFDFILKQFHVSYQDLNLVDRGYEFNQNRIFISVLIIGFGFYFLKRLIEKSENLNTTLVKELEEKNLFIQKQAAEEVHQLNNQLNLNLQQLSEREFILNQSQRIAKIGSWEYRIKNDFLFWSDAMYEIFGLDKNFDLKTRNMNEALGEEGSRRMTSATINLLRTGQPFDLIIRTKTPIGYIKWFRTYAYPIIEDNDTVGLRGICHDITFFKEAEEKLRSSEIKFSKIFANYPDFIMIVREFDLMVIDVNQRISNVLGFTKEEVIGQSARMMDLFLTEEDRQNFIKNYFPDGYTNYECSWKRKDGRIIQVKITAIRIDIDGHYYRMSVVQDITKTKQDEKDKEHALHQLNERIKELTTLYRTSQILHQEQKPFHEMLREIVSILPLGWQYPEFAAARIDLGGEIFSSPNFENSKHKQKAEFQIPPNITGVLEVVYTEDRPVESEGPFLAEERHLINMIAEMLQEHLARKHEQESLVKAQANLKATINNTEVMIWSVDRQFKLITFNIPFFEYIKKYYGAEVKIGSKVLEQSDNFEAQMLKSKWNENYTRALAGEIVTLEEARFGFDFQYSLSPIIEDNTVTGVSVFADNVTERKAADRDLAEANKKIGELKLMALRSVMSPHFIFNVLNSIQFFIAKNDRLNAITYLSTFSKLIRSILTHSVNNKIRLTDEIDMLKNYVQLEMVRFENKFNFVLNVNPEVDVEAIEIPSLLIQPYVENAILHGLYNKIGTGTLKIDIYEENETVIFQIEDDGIGREAALKLRDQNFPTHKSMGIKLTEERLQLINQKHNVIFEIQDLKNEDVPAGTRVRIGVIY